MMGHSMGGGITLRTITISDAVQAAVLYGSMSGDERQNFEKILEWSGGTRGQAELNTSDADLERISPIYHLAQIDIPVSIHHGENDGTVPLKWSLDLCDRLTELGKPVECFTYPGQPHTFQGEDDRLFIQRAIEFFEQIR
jgi:dipeptidyl aminopeptidase/acylaminoacyl peptidase